MSTAQWILNLALLGWVLTRNLGTRRVTRATFLVPLVVVGAAVAYLVTYDWPSVFVDGWDWVQSLAGWVPELPGM